MIRNGHLLLGFALAAALGAAACQGCKSGGAPRGSGSPAAEAEPSTVRIYALSDVAGALEPCGCTKDQLGGIDRLAAYVSQQRSRSRGVVLVAAGPTFFGGARRDGPEATQEIWKADALARALADVGLAAVTPGENDWAAGAGTLNEILSAARAPVLAAGRAGAAAGVVVDAGPVKVGIAGIDGAAGAAAAMRSAVRDLRAKGANILVGLAALPRGEALRLAEAVPELTVLVVGKPSSDGDADDAASSPRMLGPTLVVEPSNHLQSVAVIDLYVRGASFTFQDGSGIKSQDEIASLTQRIAELEKRLAAWEREGKMGAADIAARRAELAKMEGEKAKLAQVPPPVAGSFLRYALVEVKEGLGRDPKVRERMAAYYLRVNDHNRQALAGRKPLPVPKGGSGYVGVERCTQCHKDARAVWDRTRHARAYATLQNEHKEYNLECVGCHVTGYEEPGGSTVTVNDGLRDVQCEACHGPGGAHAAVPTTPVTRSPALSLCVTSCHHPPHVASFDAAAKVDLVLGPGHGK